MLEPTSEQEKKKRARARSITPPRTTNTELPVVQDIENCDFHGYDVDTLMKETAKLRKIITKRVVFVTNIRELYNNLVVKLQEFTYTIGAAKRIQIMSEYVNIRPSDTGDIYCIYATSIK